MRRRDGIINATTQGLRYLNDLGKKAPGPVGHKLICVHFIFDIKHDG